MARYRLCVLDDDGKVFSRATFTENGDDAAITVALDCFPSAQVEIWQDDRLLGKFGQRPGRHSSDPLSGCRAAECCRIVGPAGHLNGALKLVQREQIDLALLNVNLHGEKVFPVADALVTRGIRFQNWREARAPRQLRV